MSDEPPTPDRTGADPVDPKPDRPKPHRWDPGWLIAIPLWLGILSIGRPALVPVTFALLGFFLLRGPVRALERLRIPKAIGAALVLATLVAGLAWAVVELATPAQDWLARAPRAVRQLERELRDVQRPLAQVDAAAEKVQELTGGKSDQAATSGPSAAGRLVSGVGTLVSRGLACLMLLYLCLVFGDQLSQRIAIGLVGSRSDVLLDQLGRHLSAYLVTISAINLGLGVAVAGAMFALGVPNPILWGAFAAVANFVPYVGAVIGAVAVGLASMMAFDGAIATLLPPLAYLTLTSLEGSLVTPAILGARFRVNPVIVFLWLVLWSWLWGIPGALIAMPLLMMVKLLCEQMPSLRRVARAMER